MSDYPLAYYTDEDLETARSVPNKLCVICYDEFPMDEMVRMPACGDLLCKDCFKDYFSIAIREKSVKHFNCPICGLPDLDNNDQMLEMHLQLLVALVKVHLDSTDYDLCQKKLADFNLSKEPGFVWCTHEGCGSGFINDFRDRKKVECPDCKRLMCFLCKKKWEDQHEGKSCDQFAQWKADNDPEAQKACLAAILKENGISCPSCKTRYDLARGGSMYFHCTQCPHEFCSGCNNEYHKTADACGRQYCKTGSSKPLGLHAHHPRNCLFYLRDFPVYQLQKLLNDNNVEYDTNPPDAQVAATKEMKEKGTPLVPVDKPKAPGPDGEEGDIPKPPVHVIDGEEIELVCQVMLQKETPDGLKDEECLKSTPVGMAGLCEVHYKEYLVNKINKEGLDPVEMYEVHQVKLILKREELKVPEEEDDEGEEEYKGRLIEIIKERIPIVKKKESDYAYYTDEDLETACSVPNEPCYPCMICCYDEFPMDEMVRMPACGDLLCKDCFKMHFSIVIKEKSVKHFNCPICGLPDLDNNDQTLEMNLQLLVAMVKVHLDSTDYDLCQKKLADFNLSKEPGFVWCTHEGCGAGFINDYQTYSSADHYPLNHSSDHYHGSSSDQYHPGSSDHYHPGSSDHYHPGSSDHYHRGSSDQYHRGSSDHYHRGSSDHYHRGSSDHYHRGSSDHYHRGSSDHYHGSSSDQYPPGGSRGGSSDNYQPGGSSDQYYHQFTIGSMVRVDVQRGDPLYGIVQWIGTLPDYPGTIAGLELERTLRDCTDGTWRARRFFTCPYGRGYFCPLYTLKQDTRYMDMTQSDVPPDFQSILTSDGNEIQISSVMEENYTEDDPLYSIGNNITEITPYPNSKYEEEDERLEIAQDTRANMNHQIVLNLNESDDEFETDFTKESLHKLQKEKPQSLQDAINQQPLSFEGIIAVHQQMHSDITWYSTNFDHITRCCEELFDNLEKRRSSFRQRASQLQEVYKQNINKMTEMNENLTSRLRSYQNLHNSLTKEYQQLSTSHDTLTANHQKLLKSHDTLRKSHDSLKKEHQELRKSNATLTISHEQLQMSHDNLRITHQQEVTRHQKSQEENENRLQEVNQRLVQAQTELAAKQNEVAKLQSTLQKLENNWKVSHTEVSLSKKELGRGGWGVIWMGEFRGQRVAVKQMHDVIKSEDNMKLLHREMNTMSQLRHPNLLQFIGAVLDHPSGNPMIITEVMDTSLRSAYERKELTTDPGCRPVILSIMRDVAVGLNYLHCLPDPIIHRDVSSANVLLESKGHNKWKTKISDFGSAKFARAAVTEAPGAAVYSAPESIATLHRRTRKQTTKMDSYSYGVLLCEMITCHFPNAEKFETVKVSSPQLYELIVSCINEEPDKRPTMSEIILKLDRCIANK